MPKPYPQEFRDDVVAIDRGREPGVTPPGRLDLVQHDLDRLGFKVYLLDGERMSSAAERYAEVTRAFGFWGNWQGNPDAFNDYMGDVDLSRRAAIVWTSTRTLASADPVTFARVVTLLMLTREGLSSANASQLEIFLGE